jgi:type VII secretion protein EccE
MRTTFPLSVAAGWPRLVALFVVDVALVATGAAVAGRPGWWAGAALALVVSLLALLRWRGAALLTLAWRSVSKRHVADLPGGELADYERHFGSGRVGIRAVGPHLVAVVAVDGPPHSPSALDYSRVESMTKLPLEAVAAGLEQFDVTLEGVPAVMAQKTTRFA